MIKKKKFPSVCLFLPTQEETERKTGSSFVQNSWVNRAPFFLTSKAANLLATKKKVANKRRRNLLCLNQKGGETRRKKVTSKAFLHLISREQGPTHEHTPLFPSADTGQAGGSSCLFLSLVFCRLSVFFSYYLLLAKLLVARASSVGVESEWFLVVRAGLELILI